MDVKNPRNLTMLTDFYELTMAAGYFEEGYQDKICVFDMSVSYTHLCLRHRHPPQLIGKSLRRTHPLLLKIPARRRLPDPEGVQQGAVKIKDRVLWAAASPLVGVKEMVVFPLKIGVADHRLEVDIMDAAKDVDINLRILPVSYTHLDVYKRQVFPCKKGGQRQSSCTVRPFSVILFSFE